MAAHWLEKRMQTLAPGAATRTIERGGSGVRSGKILEISILQVCLQHSNSGFLVMDDPLVNVDPARQEKAAELMKEHAFNKQVLIFTCHSMHAELLDGNQIKL